MLPLMYVILKDSGADLEEATRRITAGKHTIILSTSFKQYIIYRAN